MGHIKMFWYAFFYTGIFLSPFFEVEPLFCAWHQLVFLALRVTYFLWIKYVWKVICKLYSVMVLTEGLRLQQDHRLRLPKLF